jgi:ParB/RepB/Spo0J family partition protein
VLSTTRTIDQLCLSPLNVRLNQQDATATIAMERSLLEQGQLEPILVHPLKGNSKKWGSHAGGRRYRAYTNLIGRGALPRDHPINVVIREGMSDAELIEESLAENMIRRDLRDYEKFAGVRRAHAHGHSAEQIAEKLGQEVDLIKRFLRLGHLAEPIFAALSEGNISTEQASAFGATSDVELQLKAWNALQVRQHVAAPAARIREALGIGNAELGKLLTYVGEDAYIAAGGRLEPDMFAEGAERRGRIVDVEILRRLADAKMDRLRADTRTRVGRPDLRFVAEPPKTTFDTNDTHLQVTPQPTGEKTAAGSGLTIPDGDVVGRVYIRMDGTAGVEFWWASRSAKHGSGKAKGAATASPRAASAAVEASALKPGAALGQQYDGAKQVADAALREEQGLSAEAIEILRSQRRMILRALLVEAARRGEDTGRDFLVWTQVRLALDIELRPSQIGASKLPSLPAPESTFAHINAMPGHRIWRDALDELGRQSFVKAPDLRQAYGDYVACPPDLKRLAEAVVAGMSLERSLGEGDGSGAVAYRVAVHDELAQELGAAALFGSGDQLIRRHWMPTTEFLAKLPAKHQLAIAEPFVEPDSWASWTRLKAAEVTRWVLAVVNGEPARGVSGTAAECAARWVHPLLRFTPAPIAPDPGHANVAAELHEAAA